MIYFPEDPFVAGLRGSTIETLVVKQLPTHLQEQIENVDQQKSKQKKRNIKAEELSK